MAAPTQAQLNNVAADIQLMSDIVNGGPADVFVNRAGLSVKSVANAINYIMGHAQNPTFGSITGTGLLISKPAGGNTMVLQNLVDAHNVIEMKYAAGAAWSVGHHAKVNDDGYWAGEFFIRSHSNNPSGKFDDVRIKPKAGLYMNGASGGALGLGSINAKAVYDDNSVLTCYVIEQYLHGSIDLDKWDGLVPDREIVQLDSAGNEISRTTEKRQHDRARGFAQFGVERLNIDNFTQFIVENERLPAFPGPEFWVDKHNRKMSDGDITQRLWETIEILAVFAMDARKREKLILQRIEDLENAA